MGSRHWLQLGDSPSPQAIQLDGENPFSIPVVMINTGSSRVQAYPGIYRQPRVRTYSDQIASVTKPGDLREFTFSVFLQGLSMDEILWNWAQVQSFLDRAEAFSSPWPRGPGITLVELQEDAEWISYWDVASGIFTDIDMNQPGFNRLGGVMQLAVAPYARGPVPLIVPVSATLTNGPGCQLYIPNVLGDAEAPTEFTLTDTSDMGHSFSRITLVRRWYPVMGSGDFTMAQASAGTLTPTSQSFQLVQAFDTPGGAHDSGYFGVAALVNDASPVLGTPQQLQAALSNAGLLSSDTYQANVVAYDNSTPRNLGRPSGTQITTVQNLVSSGGVAVPLHILNGDFDNAENQQELQWDAPLSPGAVAGSLAQIDSTSPLDGNHSYHFKAVGQTSGADCISDGRRTLPPISAGTTKIKSTRVLFKADSFSPDVLPATPSAPTLADGGAGSSGWPAGTYTFVQLIALWNAFTGPLSLGAFSAPANVTIASDGDFLQWTVPNPTPPGGGLEYIALLYCLGINETIPATGYFEIDINVANGSVSHVPPPTAFDGAGTPTFDASGAPQSLTAAQSPYARFQWGALAAPATNFVTGPFNGISVRGTATPGTFDVFVSYGATSATNTAAFTTLLGTLTLTVGTLYYLEFNYDASGTIPRWRLYVSVAGGSPPNTVLDAGIADSSIIEPAFLQISAVAMTQNPAFTDEFRFDDIMTADQFIGGIAGIGGGAAIDYSWAAPPGAPPTGYYLFVTTSDGSCYRFDVGSALSYTLLTLFAAGVELVLGPPTGPPNIAPAQLQLRTSAGATNALQLTGRAVRPFLANGNDEMVYFPDASLPPGSKSEFASVNPWHAEVWAKSGSTVNSNLTVKGLWRLPRDESGYTGFSVQAPALGQQAIWTVGTDRWGRSYCALYSKADGHLIGTVPVSGRLMLKGGDNIVGILLETDDGHGVWLGDATHLKCTVAVKAEPRWHLNATPTPVF